VNADVAEAYAVGQVVADAVKATGGFNNAKIIAYLHSGSRSRRCSAVPSSTPRENP